MGNLGRWLVIGLGVVSFLGALHFLDRLRGGPFERTTGVRLPAGATVLTADCNTGYSDVVLFPEVGGDLFWCHADLGGSLPPDSELVASFGVERYGANSLVDGRLRALLGAAAPAAWWRWSYADATPEPNLLAGRIDGRRFIAVVRKADRVHVYVSNR